MFACNESFTTPGDDSWYDLSLTPSARRAAQDGFNLSTDALRWFADQYVDPALRQDPDVSPLYASLADLGPVRLTVGTLDPFLDDNLFLYSRLVAAGNEAEIAVHPGGIHGFNALPIPISREANQGAEEFIRSRTRDAGASS